MLRLSDRIACQVLVLGLLLLTSSEELCAQATPETKRLLRLYIASEFYPEYDSSGALPHTLSARDEVYEKYFSRDRVDTLMHIVNRVMKVVLKTGLEDYGIETEIGIHTDSVDSPYSVLKNTIWLDGYASLYIKTTVSQPGYASPVFTSSRDGEMLKQRHALSDPKGWELLKEDEFKGPPLNSLLREMASALVSKVDDEIIQWFVESSIKLRVKVGDFQQADDDSGWRYLRKGLRDMVETELSRSEAMLVYADEGMWSRYLLRDSVATSDTLPCPANYMICGSFFGMNNSLRIDLRCVKIPSNRILTGGKVTIDTVNITNLSSRIADASNRLKSAMLSDFHRSTKTLAVVAEPPIRYFSTGGLSEESKEVAKLIVHNMTNKLQLLMAYSKKLDRSTNLKIYYCDWKTIDDYIGKFPTPADIINDLDIDYLMLVKIEDLGHKIRLATNMHSYDLERPALAEYIYQGEVDKDMVGSAIDTTVLRISRELCKLEILKTPVFCKILSNSPQEAISYSLQRTRDSAQGMFPDSVPVSYGYSVRQVDSVSLHNILAGFPRKILRQVRMIDFRRKKGMGIRAGPSYHVDKQFFLGKESTEYFEVFFSHTLPHPSGLPWWSRWLVPPWFVHPRFFCNEIEVSIGYDLGAGNLFRRGVVSANGFLNYKIIFAKFQYASFPVVLSAGGGIGGVGASFRYRAGDAPYVGDKTFEQGVLRFAGNAFVGAEFPLSDRLRLQGLVRWLIQRSKITDYADVPFDDSVREKPIGSLQSLFFIGGIKYVWR